MICFHLMIDQKKMFGLWAMFKKTGKYGLMWLKRRLPRCLAVMKLLKAAKHIKRSFTLLGSLRTTCHTEIIKLMSCGLWFTKLLKQTSHAPAQWITWKMEWPRSKFRILVLPMRMPIRYSTLRLWMTLCPTRKLDLSRSAIHTALTVVWSGKVHGLIIALRWQQKSKNSWGF